MIHPSREIIFAGQELIITRIYKSVLTWWLSIGLHISSSAKNGAARTGRRSAVNLKEPCDRKREKAYFSSFCRGALSATTFLKEMKNSICLSRVIMVESFRETWFALRESFIRVITSLRSTTRTPAYQKAYWRWANYNLSLKWGSPIGFAVSGFRRLI